MLLISKFELSECAKRSSIILLILIFSACHDANRNNPFDSALTPAVVLQPVRVDSTAGTATLEWTPYSGDQPFSAYWVLQGIQGLVKVDTLERIDDITQTTYLDASLEPDLDYLYRVSIVNQAGFEVPSNEQVARSFSVSEIVLFEPEADVSAGHIVLRWERYTGPNFERYDILRSRVGELDESLESVSTQSDTTWIDEGPLPETDYLYRIKLVAAGEELFSDQELKRFNLPPVELLSLKLSSETAAAELEWTRYQGPRFAAYEVLRQDVELGNPFVQMIDDINTTTYTDGSLDGNTLYTYRIQVRTTWEENFSVVSNFQSDQFYGLEDHFPLPPVDNGRVVALGLAVDEDDGLYVGTTTRLTTTARTMQEGIRIRLPSGDTYQPSICRNHQPDRRSPVYIATRDDRVYAAVLTNEDNIVVGALGLDGREAWCGSVPSDGGPPAGIYAEREGEGSKGVAGQVLVIDSQGFVYIFDENGEVVVQSATLNLTLENEDLPLRQFVVGVGVGISGLDQYFMLVPERDNNHITGLARSSRTLWGGTSFVFDDGVGPGDGQTLTPRSMAYDASRLRLVVINEFGQLQVLRAQVELEEGQLRYITKWGGAGEDAGKFFVSPPTAIAAAVDSQGKIYVADGVGERGRIQAFAP